MQADIDENHQEGLLRPVCGTHRLLSIVCPEMHSEERELALWTVGGTLQISLSKIVVVFGLPLVSELL